MWLTSYCFLSRPVINIIFLFINNHSLYQKFEKKFISLTLLLYRVIKKEKTFYIELYKD